MTCEKCRAIIADTAKFCPKCGTQVTILVVEQPDLTKKCPKCGSSYPLSAKFCKIDGSTLEDSLAMKEMSPAVEKSLRGDDIRCSQCGEFYPPGIKFCKKDGTPLQGVPSIAEETKQATDSETKLDLDTSTPTKPVDEVLSRKQKEQENIFEQKKTEINAGVIKAQELPLSEKDHIGQPDRINKCPECGTENPAAAKYCKNDGVPLTTSLTTDDGGQSVSGIKADKTVVLINDKETLVTATDRPEAKVNTEEAAGKSETVPEEKDTEIQPEEVKTSGSLSDKVVAQETVQEEPALVASKTKSSNTFIWIILLIVLFTASAGGGYYFYKNSKQKNEPTHEAESVPAAIPAPVPNQAALPAPAPEPAPVPAPNPTPVPNQKRLPGPARTH